MSTLPAPVATATASPFDALNAQQREAVWHGNDPLLVIAGAGSGKTSTLASRVARLVLDGADPQRLLLLTFSRRAAHEMERRVGQTLMQALNLRGLDRLPALPWAGTFHAVGARLLREYAARIGLSDTFSILDRGDAEDLMGWVREERGHARSKRRFPHKGTCLSIYSRVVNSQAPLHEVLAWHYPWCTDWQAELTQLFGHYAATKQQQQVLDYDDLLLYWCEMLADPGLANEVGARFDHVLVDEYQDTNRLQSAILRALKPDGRGLTVVGDDAQSIYSFRAAEVRNILDFPAQYGAATRVVALERNYRSTQPILDASNAVIALAAERHPKHLWTDRTGSEKPALVTVADELAQARWVADEVLRLREGGLRLKSQAVLFRTSHHSAALELELARRNIPFVKFGGLKFLEAAHVKDLLAVLRWATNPRNRLAGFRVAQLIPGIGPATARGLLDTLESTADPVQAWRSFEPPAAAAADWQALAGLLAHLHLDRVGWPDELAHARDWYLPHLQRLHDDAAVRQGDLDQLVRLAASQPHRERFLTELALDPPEATSDLSGPPLLDEDYLILSTIHSAKGQEWQAVYLLNAVDGCLPSDMATGTAAQIEEERRLLYVAMTRARQHLQLVVPQRFYVTQQGALGDRHLYGSLTRFVPASLAPLFEPRGITATAPATTASTTTAEGARSDVGARLVGRWR